MMRPAAAPAEIGTRTVTRLTWVGLLLAAVGWTMLLGGRELGAALGLPYEAAHLAAVAQTLVLSGLGLAILDALYTGFGALHRFFDAVLQRSAAKASQPAQAPARPPPEPQAPPNQIIERGRLNGRGYLRYRDGTVEVETLLGVRRFKSVEEAEEFVGG